MSRADKIRKAAQRTAGEVREAAKRQRDNQRRERTRREFAVEEHRHCSVSVSYTHLTLPTKA